MTDPRIIKYREMALAMQRGEFIFDLPIGDDDDEVTQLGKALLDLGQALEKRFLEATPDLCPDSRNQRRIWFWMRSWNIFMRFFVPISLMIG